MTDPRMERLERHLVRLRLVSTKSRLDSLLEEGARSELSFLDFLDKVVYPRQGLAGVDGSASTDEQNLSQ